MKGDGFNFRDQPEYGDFADRVQMYFASPQSVFFGGEHSVIDGGISIVQHIDRYVFGGVRRTKSPRPQIASVVRIATLPNRPKSIPKGFDLSMENMSDKKLGQVVAAACQRYKLEPGMEVHLLTEGFPASGANTSGAVAATISACLLWASRAMSEEEFENLGTLAPEDVALTKAEPAFQDRLRNATLDSIRGFTLEEKACFLNDLAWIIDSFSHGGKASGYGAVAGVIHTSLPFCFFPERRSPHPGFAFGPRGVIQDDKLGCKKFDLRDGVGDVEKIDDVFNAVADAVSGISFCAFTLDRFVGKGASIRNTRALPFTWGVVHSGCAKNTAEKIGNVEDIPLRRWQKYKRTRELLREADAFRMTPLWRTAYYSVETVGEEHAGKLRDPIRWEMAGLGTEMLPAMCKAMEGLGIDELAACMRRNQGLLQALGLDWYEGQLIAHEIYRSVGDRDYSHSAVKLTGGGGGGCLVFVAPRGCGGTIQESLQQMKTQAQALDIIGVYDNTRAELTFGTGLAASPPIPRVRMKPTVGTATVRVRDIEPNFCGMIGRSAAMKEIFEKIRTVARLDLTVLLTAETGTGKELVARAIHECSPRREKPDSFKAFNCRRLAETLLEAELFGWKKGSFTGAMRDGEGVFKQADGGTLFLDEIQGTSDDFQAKLLRVMEEFRVQPVGAAEAQTVDVRCIVGTNQDLGTEVKAGRFREDLYYRVRQMPIVLPPLRARREDIECLIHYFLRHGVADELCKADIHIEALTQEALERLIHYDYPGNVRELQDILRQAGVSAHNKSHWKSTIEMRDLPHEVIEPALSALSHEVSITGTRGYDSSVDRGMRTTAPEVNSPVPAAADVTPEDRTVFDAIRRQWLGHEFEQTICTAFLYKRFGAQLSKNQIKKALVDAGFKAFAQRLGYALPDTQLTERKYRDCIQRLCVAQWLRKCGCGKGVKYACGPEWPESVGTSS